MLEIMERDFRHTVSLVSLDTASAALLDPMGSAQDGSKLHQLQQQSFLDYSTISTKLINTVQVHWGLLPSDLLLRKQAAMLEVHRRGVLQLASDDSDPITLPLPAQYSLLCIERTASASSPIELSSKEVPQDIQFSYQQNQESIVPLPSPSSE
uniref:DNA alpha-glucosyltransferase n=1 Tax=Lygus hesperus TaxID=30085 RepID=A0A0A9Y5Q8_LYGHE